MIELIYNYQRQPGGEEVYAQYVPPVDAHCPSIIFGHAAFESGRWVVRVIQHPDDDVLVHRQVEIASFADQCDAILALLCCESLVEGVLRSTARS